MANAVSHASLPYPVKNARYTIPVPYLDADGDPTDPTTPDTEVSKDGGSFADCAEEVTTISGSNGLGYLTLTGAETNCSLLSVAAKVASGPKATILIDKPRVLPIILNGTASAGGNTSITLAAGAYDLTGCIVRTTGGTGGGGTGGANNQARVITAYSSLVATVEPAWETNPDNTTTYDILLTELACNTPVTRGLRPTTDGRTLDVTATGAGGIDLGNVENATTTLNLSGTTIKTATDIATAVDAVDNFIDTEIASIISTLGTPAGASLAADLVVIDDFVDALETRLTSARAGYLDNINNANLASVPAFPSNFAALGINVSGHVSRVTLTDTTTTNTDMITAAGIRTAVGLASANIDTQLAAIDDYLDTEVAAILAAVDTEIAAIVAAIGTPSNLGGGATLAANLADIEAQTDDIGTAGAGLTAIPWNASWDAEVQSECTDALNAALTESYRADQATGSVAQMLYELIAHHGEVGITGTLKTLKKIDGSTTAMSFTLNDGTTPTGITRAA